MLAIMADLGPGLEPIRELPLRFSYRVVMAADLAALKADPGLAPPELGLARLAALEEPRGAWLADLTTSSDGVGAGGMSTSWGATLGAALGSPGPGSAGPPDELRWLASLAAILIAVGVLLSFCCCCDIAVAQAEYPTFNCVLYYYYCRLRDRQATVVTIMIVAATMTTTTSMHYRHEST